MNLKTLPSLDRQKMAMTLILLEPCGINLPHTHPRASEGLYVVSGDKVLLGVVEENGSKVILNNLHKGETTAVPQGAIHFEQNLQCEPAVLIAANNNDDPGTLTIGSEFWMLPYGTLEASMGISEDEIRKIRGDIPMGPAPGASECRRKCGLEQKEYLHK
ncbi:RmlC-like cupin domain-containing protein [Powellomyces hirtus]|nr:RmlC-like cupin domain-containing protein [Powellomyces hirtus]